MKSKTLTIALSLFFIISIFATGLFTAEVQAQEELFEMSLEDILNMTVTSAGRREQKLSEVSNALTVITKDAIARSGAKQLQDLFYMVPGMQVRKINGSQYSVAVRNTSTAAVNNLLVLVDGVIVFSPGMNGTMWESVPVTLDEIERIEIIRGPGGVLYSSNAVMGTISIITKSAKTEDDDYIAIRGGSNSHVKTSFGFGAQPTENEKLFTRIYYQYETDNGLNKRADSPTYVGVAQLDDFERHNVGLRAEYDINDDSNLSFLYKQNHSTVYNGGILSLETMKRLLEMDTFALSYKRQVDENYDFDLSLGIADHLSTIINTGDQKIRSYNLRTQHNVSAYAAGDHLISFGAEWLYNALDYSSSPYVGTVNTLTSAGLIITPEQTQTISSLFIQDEFRPNDKWIITAGTRVDNNTQVQTQSLLWSPRGSVMYLIDQNQNVRVVASRVYRTPAPSETELLGNLLIGGALPLTYAGTYRLRPETVYTYEAGYKGLLMDGKLSLNADLFVTNTRDTIEIFNPTGAGITTMTFRNNGKLKHSGGEIDAVYAINENLSVRADYALLDIDAKPNSASMYITDRMLEVSQHIVGAGLQFTQDRLKCDVYVKYVSSYNQGRPPFETTLIGLDSRTIKHYYKSFIRLAYEVELPGMPDADAEIEVIANDLGTSHIEERLYHYSEPKYYAGIKVKF